LNKAGLKGQVLAVRSLPSRDLILTSDEAGTRTEWLQVLGGVACIKKMEFIAIAYGIRVNQVQDQLGRRKRYISITPNCRDTLKYSDSYRRRNSFALDILKGPLHIIVAEPERANILNNSGLNWNC
jgi:hypothetical protein